MKKALSKILSLTLAVLLVCSVIPAAGLLPDAFAATHSGSCGKNVKWSFDTSTGVLNITGSGKMKDCGIKVYADHTDSTAPWCSYCSEIKTVKIANGVTSIGNGVFFGCSNLKSITIPDSVTGIGSSAFRNCSSLTGIEIPDSVTSIGNFAFSGCGSLKSVTIPDGVKSVNVWTFWGCSSLTSVTIPDSVMRIGHSAFSYCSSLTSVTIPDSVTSIDAWAFEDCSSLTSVTIPDSVTSIGDNVFFGCSSLKRITIMNPECSISDHSPDTIPENAVMFGKDNSTAQEYALLYCREFKTICQTHSFTCSSFIINGSSASLILSCPKCGCCYSVKSDKLSPTTTKATCAKDGKTVYTATVANEGKTYTFSKTVAVKKASDISISTSSYVYTGENRTIKFTVKDSSGKTLVKDTDYTVSYPTGRKTIGKHTVKLTFKGNYSGTKTLTFKIVPGKVTGLKAAQTTSTVKLTWKAVNGAKTYRIYKYNSSKKEHTQVGLATGTSYTVKDLKAGTEYTYYVKASKTVDGVEYSSDTYAKIKTATKPSTPKTPTLTALTKKITAKWTKPSGATGCELYMKKGSSGTYKRIYYGPKTSFTKSSLTKGSTYYFRVRAYKTVNGNKIYSAYSGGKYTKAK